MRRLGFAIVLVLVLAACGGGGGGGDDDDGGDDDGGDVDAAVTPDAAPNTNPLDGIGTVELVDDGYMFLEGPQWLDGSQTLLFTDIPANTIFALAVAGAIEPFRDPSGNANGLAIAPGGALLAAEHGNRRVSITEGNGAPEDLATTYQSMRFNSPNDVVVRSDGTVYFTDPPYGLEDDNDRELPFMGVFRTTTAGGEPVAEWEGPLTARPNGIGLSPDERILYVSDTDEGVVRAFDVAADGSLSGERILTDDTPGADGLAIDVSGNLYVTTSAGIRVIAPDGTTWGTVEVPMQPSNCAFGGAGIVPGGTLYITARGALYRASVARPGLPTH
jgi:gluconolactonase